jgi:hypothetical protein
MDQDRYSVREGIARAHSGQKVDAHPLSPSKINSSKGFEIAAELAARVRHRSSLAIRLPMDTERASEDPERGPAARDRRRDNRARETTPRRASALQLVEHLPWRRASSTHRKEA